MLLPGRGSPVAGTALQESHQLHGMAPRTQLCPRERRPMERSPRQGWLERGPTQSRPKTPEPVPGQPLALEQPDSPG